MGVLKNLVNAKMSGNVGSMNFRKRGSQVVVAERSYSNSSKGQGATEAQRMHRSRLANVVNFFKAIKSIEARAWENKAENCSDFNYLSKFNLATSPIFLAKDEAQAGASVVAPYIVSRGSLEGLVSAFDTTGFKVGVVVAENFSFANNTLATFSEGVIANNAGWQNGDKLSIAILNESYKTIAGLQIPMVSVQYVEITLDVESTKNMMEVAGVSTANCSCDANGNMYIGASCIAAFAIHSRKANGMLLTSSQSVILKTPADAIYTKYTGDAQKAKAMLSYGYQEDVLLTPGAVTEAQVVEPTIATISSIKYAGSAISSGATLEGGANLVIEGSDFKNDNVKVMVGGTAYVPTASSTTSRTYSLAQAGNLVIYVNGESYLTATVTAYVDGIQVTMKAGVEFQWPLSNQHDYVNQSFIIYVKGRNLGAVTCTGGTIRSMIVDTPEEKSIDFVCPNAGNVAYTISVGNEVIYSGTTQTSEEL